MMILFEHVFFWPLIIEVMLQVLVGTVKFNYCNLSLKESTAGSLQNLPTFLSL